jgi:hypothetical protein
MAGHLFLVKVDRSLIGQLPVIIGQKKDFSRPFAGGVVSAWGESRGQ